MSQPKIITQQLDLGTGGDALLTSNTFFVAGSGRTYGAIHGTLGGMSGTTVIPFDNTAPLITEGTQFGSAVLTKVLDTSHTQFDFSLTIDASTNNTFVVVAVFRDTTCVASAVVSIDTAGRPKVISLTGHDAPGVAGNYTYSGRIGVASAGPTWYVNSTSSGNNLGGTLSTAFVLWESA